MALMANPLLQEIEAFLSRDDVRITETAFGIAALNDGKFISELRHKDRRVWPETAEKVRAFMENFHAAANQDRQTGAAA